MKILYLSEVRLPTKNAHGFQIMYMCDAFARVGNSVKLVVPWRRNLLKEDPFTFYGVPRSFDIVKIPAIDLYPLRFVPEKISRLVLIVTFLLSARIYSWFSHFDVVYTREEQAGRLFPRAVFEVHMPEQVKPWLKKAKGLITLTHGAKEVLVRQGIPEKKLLVAPDAADLARFANRIEKKEAKQKLGFLVEKPVVMYWGNFRPWKGVDTLAKAARELPDAEVVIVGGTKESDIARIQDLVKGEKNVLVKGFTPYQEQPVYLAAADILILPNTAHEEISVRYTSPLKLFEYMASSRPIVASDLPSLREILNHTNAVLVHPDDPAALARGIKQLLLNPAEAHSLALHARELVEQYTWEARASRITDFLHDIR